MSIFFFVLKILLYLQRVSSSSSASASGSLLASINSLKTYFMDFKLPPLSRDDLTKIIVSLDFYEQFLIQTEYNGNPYSIEPGSALAQLRELCLTFYIMRSDFFG